MPFQIVHGDITEMKVDAIVNAANSSLLGVGGVDGAIHSAAGIGLYKECLTLGGCETGDAKITLGYNLPCKHVIHTVGPIWQGGNHGEHASLTSCYLRSLQLASEHECESVAFPLISAGVYGYPADQAIQVASRAIIDYLKDHDLTVYLVIYDKHDYQIDRALHQDLLKYIDQNYTTEPLIPYAAPQAAPSVSPAEEEDDSDHWSSVFHIFQRTSSKDRSSELQAKLEQLDEGFADMLLRKIDEKGLTDAQCYKRANVDRKLFSKIRSNRDYKPSKPTAIAFIIALELPLDEAMDMLKKAGYALSHSNKFDVIIEYFISNGMYDIFTINEALFAFDQRLLGG